MKDIRAVAVKMYDDLARAHAGSMTEFTLDWQVLTVEHPQYGKVQQTVPLLHAKWKYV